MNFFETVMGRQFYQGTMPSIAKSLAVIADRLEKLDVGDIQPKGAYVVIKSNNFNREVSLLKNNDSSSGAYLFKHKIDASNEMIRDIIRSANEKDEETISSIPDLEKAGYEIELADEHATLFTGSINDPDADEVYWNIIRV